ncbi:hypothetical protein IMZ11_36510 [Microtetraspora sp. AC03309]|uniref:hypothetical protein n=1 Tax=Microtetraspora sp. AC03309 TaxID=2779376 RepID=UPI001E30F45B|nr:hypothetical protein [Microtetraspora sp. AC03309]MCC5581127.1 hypothetical protein [Microtetraspora sp. AC03309]
MTDLTRKTRLGLAFAAIAVASSAIIPASAATASTAATTTTTMSAAPLAWHSGYFTKSICYKDARSFAQSALRRYGYAIAYNPPNAVLGTDGTTTVEVSFAPAQTSYNPNTFSKVNFTVTAISNTSSLAENARNRVRENIVKQVYFDYC